MSPSTPDVDKMLEDRNISGLIDVIARASDPRYDPVCNAAALALGKIGEAAIGPILQVVKQRRLYTENERGLLSSLSHITDVQTVEPLAGILAQKHRGEEYAAHALGEIGGARAVEALILVLQDPNRMYEVRLAAAEALGRCKDARGVDSLIFSLDRWKGKPYALELGQVLIRSLGQIGDRRGCEPIIDALFQSVGIGYSGPSREVGNRDYRWRDYKQDLQNLFLDYAWIITDLVGFTMKSKVDEEGAREYDRLWESVHPDQRELIPPPHVDYYCIIDANLSALDHLCRNSTPVSSNLLHKIKNIPVETSLSGRGEIIAFAESFARLRKKAEEELVRRGHPPHDSSLYFREESWRLPVSR